MQGELRKRCSQMRVRILLITKHAYSVEIISEPSAEVSTLLQMVNKNLLANLLLERSLSGDETQVHDKKHQRRRKAFRTQY